MMRHYNKLLKEDERKDNVQMKMHDSITEGEAEDEDQETAEQGAETEGQRGAERGAEGQTDQGAADDAQGQAAAESEFGDSPLPPQRDKFLSETDAFGESFDDDVLGLELEVDFKRQTSEQSQREVAESECSRASRRSSRWSASGSSGQRSARPRRQVSGGNKGTEALYTFEADGGGRRRKSAGEVMDLARRGSLKGMSFSKFKQTAQPMGPQGGQLGRRASSDHRNVGEAVGRSPEPPYERSGSARQQQSGASRRSSYGSPQEDKRAAYREALMARRASSSIAEFGPRRASKRRSEAPEAAGAALPMRRGSSQGGSRFSSTPSEWAQEPDADNNRLADQLASEVASVAAKVAASTAPERKHKAPAGFGNM